MNRPFKIALLAHEDCAALAKEFQLIGWDKPVAIFEKYFAEQTLGERTIYIAKLEDKIIGYITIQWISEHSYFKEHSIPEIKDFNILPAYQKQGFGKKLLEFVEQQISVRSKTVGIGVGLIQDYGAAQRLYVKCGYIPTGEGASHHNKALKYGDTIQVDDDTILWFTKNLPAEQF